MTNPYHPQQEYAQAPQFAQGPQYPVPPQPPVPEKKKRKKWPWIVGVVAVVIVIASVSGNSGADKPSTPAGAANAPVAGAPEAPDAPAVKPADKPTPALNTPVRDGKFEFVVTDVQTGLSEVGDNPYLQQKAQGQFVVVTMTVSNTSNKAKSLSPSDQKMYDSQGREFEADPMAAINVGSDVPVWDQINPGNTVTVKAVYDMPVGAVPDHIELHDSMFSGGAKVSLR
ncbi:DUF4352 domain-containing protein [Rhodococcus sp. D2-41]|uniref:DUF4352 domain-containing protein n=1 Tax=Speluncibacter jeojiensis TaxID=2710754 RepID=UPI00240FD166|nr:DUF4352 domain-containing protein [Rhodococcus sp. D2-41]MDG3012287.1 DUF4352 domain-containing protein [Rhodococcus sp. D2-41]